MQYKLGAGLGLLAFAVCLVQGGIHTGNPFTTTVLRALMAMAGSFGIGLILGWAAQRMLQENLASTEEKLRKNQESRPQ